MVANCMFEVPSQAGVVALPCLKRETWGTRPFPPITMQQRHNETCQSRPPAIHPVVGLHSNDTREHEQGLGP